MTNNRVPKKVRQVEDGVQERRQRLARYVTWTPEDLAEFNEALAAQPTIDEHEWGELRQGDERFLR